MTDHVYLKEAITFYEGGPYTQVSIREGEVYSAAENGVTLIFRRPVNVFKDADDQSPDLKVMVPWSNVLGIVYAEPVEKKVENA